MTTKRIAKEVNVCLRRTLPASWWADCLVIDMEATKPISGNPEQILRRAKGLLRSHYGNVSLTEAELKAALKRAGSL
jgi:hypothetical protein